MDSAAFLGEFAVRDKAHLTSLPIYNDSGYWQAWQMPDGSMMMQALDHEHKPWGTLYMMDGRLFAQILNPVPDRTRTAEPGTRIDNLRADSPDLFSIWFQQAQENMPPIDGCADTVNMVDSPFFSNKEPKAMPKDETVFTSAWHPDELFDNDPLVQTAVTQAASYTPQIAQPHIRPSALMPDMPEFLQPSNASPAAQAAQAQTYPYAQQSRPYGQQAPPMAPGYPQSLPPYMQGQAAQAQYQQQQFQPPQQQNLQNPYQGSVQNNHPPMPPQELNFVHPYAYQRQGQYPKPMENMNTPAGQYAAANHNAQAGVSTPAYMTMQAPPDWVESTVSPQQVPSFGLPSVQSQKSADKSPKIELSIEPDDDAFAEARAKKLEGAMREEFENLVGQLDDSPNPSAEREIGRLILRGAGFTWKQKFMFTEFGLTLRRKHKMKLALACHQRALGFAPNDEHILFNVARSEYELGDVEAAKDHLAKALKVAPSFDVAKNFLSFLQGKSNKGASGKQGRR